MKEIIKISLKNASLNSEEGTGEIIVTEFNKKDEVIGETSLNDIYERFEDMESLKVQIDTGNTMTCSEVKAIIDKFIGKDKINIAIQSEKEI